MSKTVKQIAEMEGVTKHAIKERMDYIPDFRHRFVSQGEFKGRQCMLISDAGVEALRKRGLSYRSLNHDKANSSNKARKHDSYKLQAERNRHQLEEIKTGRKMLQQRLATAKQLVEMSKSHLQDVSTDRNHWREVATSAQSQVAMNSAKDSKLAKLALQSQANSYEARLHKALPSTPKVDTKALEKKLADYKAENRRLSKKANKKSIWSRIFK